MTTESSNQLNMILDEIELTQNLGHSGYKKILSKYPKNGNGIFSHDELISFYKAQVKSGNREFNQATLDKIRMKPTRTISGVAPVTVLTKPYPCPGKCIFCPTDVKMPKSYISSEPGAQRAARNSFDPYLQTYNRLLAFSNTGHNTDKTELIILGGTWSYYPKNYRLWFIKRCFDAMNDFPDKDNRKVEISEEKTTWEDIYQVQKSNENAETRNVGLVVETRPDYINKEELIDLRRLGVTKIQIGVQNLNDEILRINGRGHTSKQVIDAINAIRSSGFKVHIHWMPNLFGSTFKADKEDYLNVFKLIMPDEMKIYPTSIIRGTVLNRFYEQGRYKPYTFDELLDLLTFCFLNTPRYCRLSRVVRDIPSQEIAAGNKHSNFRQIAENQLIKEGKECECIRCREIRGAKTQMDNLLYEEIVYKTPSSREYFMSYKTNENDKLVGFLRLSFPLKSSVLIDELSNSAIIREVHVYGQVAGLSSKSKDRSQHIGIGKSLIQKAIKIAEKKKYKDIAVISAIGTREYYRAQGFEDGDLYLHKAI